MAKRKLSKKQLQALAKGRAKLKSMKKRPRQSNSRTVVKTTVKVQKVAKRRAKRRTSKPSKKGMFANVSGMLGAVAYGAVREQLSETIAKSRIGQQLPATQFTDEAVMLALNFGARKVGLGKNPIGNSVLRAQKTVELARIGQGIRDVMQTKNATKSPTNGSKMVVLS